MPCHYQAALDGRDRMLNADSVGIGHGVALSLNERTPRWNVICPTTVCSDETSTDAAELPQTIEESTSSVLVRLTTGAQHTADGCRARYQREPTPQGIRGLWYLVKFETRCSPLALSSARRTIVVDTLTDAEALQDAALRVFGLSPWRVRCWNPMALFALAH